jgi:hypothetical protein
LDRLEGNFLHFFLWTAIPFEGETFYSSDGIFTI